MAIEPKTHERPVNLSNAEGQPVHSKENPRNEFAHSTVRFESSSLQPGIGRWTKDGF